MIENPQYKEGAKKVARSAGSGIKRGASAAKGQTINFFAGSGGGGGNGGGGGKKKGVSDTLVKMAAVAGIIGGGGYLLYKFLQGGKDPEVPAGSITVDSVEVESETPKPDWWDPEYKPPVAPGDDLTMTVTYHSNWSETLIVPFEFGIRRTGHSPDYHYVYKSVETPPGETQTCVLVNRVPLNWDEHIGDVDVKGLIDMAGEDNDEFFQEDDMFRVSNAVDDRTGLPGEVNNLKGPDAQSNILVQVGNDVSLSVGYLFSGVETTLYIGALIRNDNCGTSSSCNEEHNVYIQVTHGPDDRWTRYIKTIEFEWPEILSQHSEYDVFPYWSLTDPSNVHIGDGTVDAGGRIADVFKVKEDPPTEPSAEITSWDIEPTPQQIVGGVVSVKVYAENLGEQEDTFECIIAVNGTTILNQEKTFSGTIDFNQATFIMPDGNALIKAMIRHYWDGYWYIDDTVEYTLTPSDPTPETKSFVGYVRTLDGDHPVVGALVRSTGSPPYEDITNEVGYFRIDSIEAGPYTSITFKVIADGKVPITDIVSFNTDEDFVQRIYFMEADIPDPTETTGTIRAYVYRFSGITWVPYAGVEIDIQVNGTWYDFGDTNSSGYLDAKYTNGNIAEFNVGTYSVIARVNQSPIGTGTANVIAGEQNNVLIYAT